MNKLIAQIIAILIAIIWVLPLVGIAMVSIRPLREVLDGWWNLSEFNPTLDNYQIALTSPTTNLARGFMNSLLVATFATIIPISSLIGLQASRPMYRTFTTRRYLIPVSTFRRGIRRL